MVPVTCRLASSGDPHGRSHQSRIGRQGGVVARYARPGWVGSPAFNYICFDHNSQLRVIRESRTRYRFSDFAPHDDVAHGDYWSALSEASIGDALCATAYGADRRVASLHLGFAGRDIAPAIGGGVDGGKHPRRKLIAFDAPEPEEALSVPVLSGRERDALFLVAEGKTDWEMARIMGISESTARFHVDNARRKLDCVNRAHAVARFLASSQAF